MSCALELEGGGEVDDRLSDSAVKSEWLWPQANFNAVLPPELAEWKDFRNALSNDLSPLGKELRATVEELHENTPIRFHFYDSEEEVSGERHYTFFSIETYEAAVLAAGGVVPRISGASSGLGTFHLEEHSEGMLYLASSPGALKHELGHAFGLDHTQNRIDRDENVDIHWDAMESDHQQHFQFEESDASKFQDIGPYDINSVMHYDSFAGAVSPRCAVMTVKGAPSSCRPEADPFLIASTDVYSKWNYIALSALYCDDQFCGDTCASEAQCSTPKVSRNLQRFEHWEATGEVKLPPELAICGDDVVDGDEECDGGDNCSGDCTREECGDSIVTGDEECDSGAVDTEACNADCTLAECGDGYVNRLANESCDAGGESSVCNLDCSPALCGDAIINASANETCDPGSETQECNSNCTLSSCGDYIVNRSASESCDTGGQSAECEQDCQLSTCGDYKVNLAAGEDCDTGSQSQECDSNCRFPVCGDGIVNTYAGEECEPGDGDCQPDCRYSSGDLSGCHATEEHTPWLAIALMGLILLSRRRRSEA